jgi:uncharacterized protein YukE
MNDIFYNFGENHGYLTDIHSSLQAVDEVRNDINSVFETLRTVYEGEGADQLQLARQKFSQAFEECITNSVSLQKFAQDQQDAMQALDKANAAAL